MQIQVLIHKIISGAVNRKVVCNDLPERPGRGACWRLGGRAAELWHICVFIVRRGGAGGRGEKVKQYLQLSCFQRGKRNRVHGETQRAGGRVSRGGLWGEVGEVGLAGLPPSRCAPCLGTHRGCQDRPLRLQALVWPRQWAFSSDASPGMGGSPCPSSRHIQPHLQ